VVMAIEQTARTLQDGTKKMMQNRKNGIGNISWCENLMIAVLSMK